MEDATLAGTDDFCQGVFDDIEKHDLSPSLALQILDWRASSNMYATLSTVLGFIFSVSWSFQARRYRPFLPSSGHWDRPGGEDHVWVSPNNCTRTYFHFVALFSSSTIWYLQIWNSWAFWTSSANRTLTWNAAAVFTSILADVCGDAVSYDGDTAIIMCMMHLSHSRCLPSQTSHYDLDTGFLCSRT